MILEQMARSLRGEVLSCLAVPTFVRVVGAGPPVFVIHGGPGFSHGYLVGPLESLASRRTLVFFDQPGCGRSGRPDGALTAKVAAHFRALTQALVAPGQPFGVLAHSWGALVLFGADLPVEAGVTPAEGLLVAPVPTTRAGWDRAVSELLGRIPPAIAASFMNGLASDDDISFDPLLPFYCTAPLTPSAAEIRVRGATYRSVVERLGDYDLGPQARRVLPQLDLLLGQFDFTTPDMLVDAVAAARRCSILPTGHFPFWEDPAGFEAALARAFP